MSSVEQTQEEKTLQAEYDDATSQMKELETRMQELQQQKNHKVLQIILKDFQNFELNQLQLVFEDQKVENVLYSSVGVVYKFPIKKETDYTLEFIGKIEKVINGEFSERITDVDSSPTESAVAVGISNTSVQSNDSIKNVVDHESKEDEFKSQTERDEVPVAVESAPILDDKKSETNKPLEDDNVDQPASNDVTITINSNQFTFDSADGQWLYSADRKDVGVFFIASLGEIDEDEMEFLKLETSEISQKYDAISLSRSRADKKLKKIRSAKNVKVKKLHPTKGKKTGNQAVERGFLNKKSTKKSEGKLGNGWKHTVQYAGLAGVALQALKNPIIFGAAVAFFAFKGDILAV